MRCLGDALRFIYKISDFSPAGKGLETFPANQCRRQQSVQSLMMFWFSRGGGLVSITLKTRRGDDGLSINPMPPPRLGYLHTPLIPHCHTASRANSSDSQRTYAEPISYARPAPGQLPLLLLPRCHPTRVTRPSVRVTLSSVALPPLHLPPPSVIRTDILQAISLTWLTPLPRQCVIPARMA